MTTQQQQQVFYRKWRPGTFSDLAGQGHVGRTLRQAVIQGRVAHSYLFCGSLGSGKTTTARVLAKAVNCVSPQEGDPCQQCGSCKSITEGRNMDIVELDAASNRGVEEMREIRDKVNFQPAQSKRKVYIIDEAHMLTREASNAFLKTLEEPPAHVLFILCTTEADRILPTIQSRCQRYDFHRLPGQTVYERLTLIAKSENIDIAPDALRLIARNCGGSMRDALNVLEQITVSVTGRIGVAEVKEALGLSRGDGYLEIARLLLAGEATPALENINRAVWEGADPRQLHKQILDILHAAMLIALNAASTLDLSDDALAAVNADIAGKEPKQVVRAMRLWSEAGAGLRYDAPSAVPLELATARICHQDEPETQADFTSVPGRQVHQSGRRDESRSESEPPRADPARELRRQWLAAVRSLEACWGERYNIGALLQDCPPASIRVEDGRLSAPFRHTANLARLQSELSVPAVASRIEYTLREHFAAELTLAPCLHGDTDTLASPLAQAAVLLGARITSPPQS